MSYSTGDLFENVEHHDVGASLGQVDGVRAGPDRASRYQRNLAVEPPCVGHNSSLLPSA
jgi:hypothetical protein